MCVGWGGRCNEVGIVLSIGDGREIEFSFGNKLGFYRAEYLWLTVR